MAIIDHIYQYWTAICAGNHDPNSAASLKDQIVRAFIGSTPENFSMALASLGWEEIDERLYCPKCAQAMKER